MIKKLSSIVAVSAMLAVSAPALAGHVSPANTNLTFTGTGALNGNPCTLQIDAVTGPVVGHGNHADGGTFTGFNSGAGICGLITINKTPLATVPSATFDILDFTPGAGVHGLGQSNVVLNNVDVYVGTAAPVCSGTGLPAVATNTPTGVSLSFSASIGGCTAVAAVSAAGGQVAP